MAKQKVTMATLKSDNEELVATLEDIYESLCDARDDRSFDKVDESIGIIEETLGLDDDDEDDDDED